MALLFILYKNEMAKLTISNKMHILTKILLENHSSMR